MSNDVQYISVKTLAELKRALFPFSKNGRENARKLLLDALENLKNQIDAHEKAYKEIVEHSDVFGGLEPAPMQNPAEAHHYVDDIITKKLGGKRVGYKVKWLVQEGTYEWDAFDDTLKKVE